jgi:hypothetical protein
LAQTYRCGGGLSTQDWRGRFAPADLVPGRRGPGNAACAAPGANAKLPIFPYDFGYRRAPLKRAEVKLGRETVELDGAAG